MGDIMLMPVTGEVNFDRGDESDTMTVTGLPFRMKVKRPTLVIIKSCWTITELKQN
jgi:hypothetical protein